ncbi:MAG: class I SAM-dependent methyltransferase [Ignavibacteriae bacterium]|nr:MAG: class I SAM-dependent methyltransferase [Ignavibacteriota bacterium]
MENFRSNSTTRFSDKVDNYVKYRPHYPQEIITYLKDEGIIKEDYIIADIGSGTGISTELFLTHVKKVYAIEPNDEMRNAGEKMLSQYSNFMSIKATAENTTLPDNSIDVICAGQAFHWFDLEKSREEFKRVLKPGSYVILMWNVRKLYGTPFLDDYEKMLLKYGTDYIKVRHEGVGHETKVKFYGNDKFTAKIFYNEQVFDYEGLEGRLLSSSYIPRKFEPGYDEMLEELKIIFDRHNENGKIKVVYDTEVYVGRLKG